MSSTYIRNVNITNTHITNVTNITNNYYHNNFTNTHYANRSVNGAVTAAPGSAIASGRAMNHAGQAVPSSALMHAPEMRNVNLTPTHNSMLGGQQPRSNAVPPASAMNRGVGDSRDSADHDGARECPQSRRGSLGKRRRHE